MAKETADISTESEGEDAPRRRSRAPILIGLAGCLAAAGGGYFATSSGAVALPGAVAGMLGGGGGDAHGEHGKDEGGKDHAAAPEGYEFPAYVPVEQMVIPLGPNAKAEFLVIETAIETAPADVQAFENLRPRVRDVFNTFLRTVEESDIEDPSATLRLRAQLLRRVRAVAAPLSPRDVLITSFILK